MSQTPVFCKSSTNSTTSPLKSFFSVEDQQQLPRKTVLEIHPWGYPYLLKPFLCRLRNPSEDAAPDLPAIRDLKKLEFA